ncbi:MAG: DUF2283 domain-containing protein [Methanobrevibacter sp.]|nr:DUF2283 domain-containing protein [Methanobrevibacter sp.]
MNNSNHFDVIYKYEPHYDMLGIKITDNYTYNQSVEMIEGVIVDFDTENKPVAIQIIGGSRLFKIPKAAFSNIRLIDVKIKITENSISLSLIIGVYIHNKKLEQSFNSLVANDSGLPNFEAELATA